MTPFLLFIHGAGGNHRIWEYQTAYFSNSMAVDLPGHPRGVSKSSIDEYVEEVKRLCDELRLRDIVMVGASMGGAVVQKFALDYSEYLRAIVLVSTGAKLKVLPIVFESIRKDYTQALNWFAKFGFSGRTGNEIKEMVIGEMRNIDPEIVYNDFEACDKFNIIDRLKEMRMPTLVICGLEDQLTPVKYSQFLKDNISNSELEIIADAGHMVMLEKPEEFNGRLERFIKRLCLSGENSI